MPVHADESKAPLLYLHYIGDIADADIDRASEVVLRWSEGGTPYGVIVDALRSAPLTAAQRRRLSQGMSSPAHVGVLRCCVTVVDSAVLRGMLTAMSWLSTPPFPVEAARTLTEAEAWVREQLRSAR